MSVYAAQIDSIDQNVGRLLGRLESHDCLDNTVFVFLSDNGCSAEGGPGGFRRANQAAEIGTDESYASAGLEWANVSDTPFRKFKTQTHEGGISSPFIVHWPNGLDETGRIEHQLGHVIDLMPTCVGLTGAEYPTERNGIPVKPMEGTSLVNAFRGQSIEREPLFWEHQGNRAVRDGSWKLVAAHKGDWELYDMSTDRAETNNLASEQPAVVAQLAKAWDTWADRCNVLPWPVK
jgi:arylsulfatase